ncbi:MAG: M14 family metallopeptidase [bacterium]|nr:M14 family metallopeptidase [bacterium]
MKRSLYCRQIVGRAVPAVLGGLSFGAVLVAVAGIRLLWAASFAYAEPLQIPSADVPAEWLTEAERSDFARTPRYDATVAYCRRLAEASPWIDYQTFGTSPQGRPLPLLVASTDRAFTPAAAKATGKLIVFVQNCIHAGECEGKDASLMLLRDAVITKARAALLDNVILLVNPIFNVDGHERFGPYSRINQNGPERMGWRVTSRNLNLNRDYLKADAVEMRAWLALWNAWRPDLHFDNHTTDGGDWQYDLTLAADTHAAVAPQIAGWLRDTLYPQLMPALEADGHVPMTYFSLVESKDPTKGIRSGGFGPRYSTGYAVIRNRPSILVETHMLKPYRTRVICHYNIMRRVLELLNRDPQPLRQAINHAEADTVKWGSAFDPERRLPVAIGRTDESVPFTFKGFAYRRELSDVSGDVRIIYDNTNPVEFETVWYNRTEATREVTPPLGYLIGPEWTEVIELAQAHGLRMGRLPEPVTAEFHSYHFEEVTFPSRPYEGRFEARFKTVPIVETRTYPAGSVLIMLNQPDAKVAVHLFEPEAPDSLVRWGFFNTIFEQKEYAEHYVAEALAREMMQADPELAFEFQERVRTDREFAANPRARLNYFYRRSPYWDDRLNVYPVARLQKPLPAATGSGADQG